MCDPTHPSVSFRHHCRPKIDRAHALISLIGLICVAIPGCMRAAYGTNFVAGADYGQPMAQVDAQDRARTFMKTFLKDPLSAQYEWNPIQQAWIHMQPTAFTPRLYGYALEGIVNSKNSYGGYVGFTRFRFFFREGELLQVAEFQDGFIWCQVYPPPP